MMAPVIPAANPNPHFNTQFRSVFSKISPLAASTNRLNPAVRSHQRLPGLKPNVRAESSIMLPETKDCVSTAAMAVPNAW